MATISASRLGRGGIKTLGTLLDLTWEPTLYWKAAERSERSESKINSKRVESPILGLAQHGLDSDKGFSSVVWNHLKPFMAGIVSPRSVEWHVPLDIVLVKEYPSIRSWMQRAAPWLLPFCRLPVATVPEPATRDRSSSTLKSCTVNTWVLYLMAFVNRSVAAWPCQQPDDLRPNCHSPCKCQQASLWTPVGAGLSTLQATQRHRRTKEKKPA